MNFDQHHRPILDRLLERCDEWSDRDWASALDDVAKIVRRMPPRVKVSHDVRVSAHRLADDLWKL